MKSTSIMVASLLAVLTASAREASAQVVYVQQQPQQVYVQQPQPVYVQQQPQQVYVQPMQPQQPVYNVGRVRYGFDGGVGYFGAFRTGIGVHGFSVNGTGRLGYQVNDLFAIYGQLGAMAGFGIGSSTGGFLLALPLTIAADFTFGNVFHVGGGPSLDVAIGAVGSSSGSIGAFPGLDLHAAVTIGRPTMYGGRTGLILGVRPHFTVLFNSAGYDGTYVSMLAFAGYEWF